MSPSVTSEDSYNLVEWLAIACRRQGLRADVLSPTRVRVFLPGAALLTEMVTIKPDERETLAFYWSWGERICPASDVATAVASIKHVVTPSVHSEF